MTAELPRGHLGILARATQAACANRAGRLQAELERAKSEGVASSAVEEALLQLHLFAGYPAMINALWAWREIAGEKPRGKRAARSRTGGREICRKIYGADYAKMMQNMARLHPAVADWIISDGYGRVMVRSGLSLRDREALAVAALVAVRAWRQLGPHLRALLRMGYASGDLKSLLGARIPSF